MRIAIIGGTGVYDPTMLSNVRDRIIDTPYGAANVRVGSLNGEEIVFLTRHGVGHTVPPHMINYQANIAALKMLGVERAIATSAVGTLNPDMKPGSFVILDQFIDLAKARVHTFFDGGEHGLRHIDYTEPYCPEIRSVLIDQAKKLGITAHPSGCYMCCDGPRFETAAEIRMFRSLGADVVGMTSVPETVLAREAQICYSSIAMATNWAAGISSTPLTHTEVEETMRANGENLRRLIVAAIENLPRERSCACTAANVAMPWLDEYKKTHWNC